jgi:GAF domain-containing protein
MTQQTLMESADAFAELGRINFRETTFDAVLARIAGLTRRTVPGAAAVSVTLVGGGGAHTATCTGEQASALDQWQYAHGHGPCLAAAAANITVPVTDMAGECRWPDWAEQAIGVGVHSAVSVGVPLYESVTGALNIYATEPGAFDDDAVILAQTFAGYLAVAMANTGLYADGAGLARHMRDAMGNRAVIEQAKGVIMADRHCAPEEASAILARISEYTGRDAVDVATELVSSAAETPTP